MHASIIRIHYIYIYMHIPCRVMSRRVDLRYGTSCCVALQ